jgi:hypothetical protein
MLGGAMLGGCNLVFTTSESQPDAGNTTVDGKVDNPNESNFDGDGLPDNLDPCPISPNNSTDSDNDGVPDDCDVTFAKKQTVRQCVLMFRGFPQGTELTQEQQFPPVLHARNFRVSGAVTALTGTLPRVEFRVRQGALAWDGVGAAVSDNDQLALAGEFRTSNADGIEKRLATTNSNGVTDNYHWAVGDFLMLGDLGNTMFASAYRMVGQSNKGTAMRTEPIPFGQASWTPTIASSNVPSVDLSKDVDPTLFVANATFRLSYVLVTGDCP